MRSKMRLIRHTVPFLKPVEGTILTVIRKIAEKAMEYEAETLEMTETTCTLD